MQMIVDAHFCTLKANFKIMEVDHMQQFPVGEIIKPILIETPFAVGPVYSYLIKDEKIVLVDCGHHAESSFDKLNRSLRDEGLEVRDIDEIWLTHGHPDHYGQAALLADKAGAVAMGHPKERANFAANADGELFEAFFHRHNIPATQVDLMVDQLEWLQQYQLALEPQWIEEGDVLESGTLDFTVKHVPGHAPGHLVFYRPGDLYFGGDVLLNHISTNALINFDPDTGERNKSLLQYRRSLQWMQQQSGVVLPGHGKQIANIADKAVHHLNEQRQRYQKIKELLREKPRGLVALAQTMFPDALKKNAHFLVFSEIMGYLDWGMQEGMVNGERVRDQLLYSVE